MTVEHPDADIVTGGHRAAQQMIFTLTQLVENVARMRQAADARRADAARAAEAQTRTAERAADRQQREAAARQRTDRAAYTTAADPRWRRTTAPADLLTAWAAATTWAAHDTKAADVMLRTEDEMRVRWPQVLDRYDRLRVADGLHPAAAMKITLTDALNAGWDPATNPAARPHDGHRLVLPAGTTEQATPEQATPGQATPEQTAPEQVAPAAVAPDQAAAGQATPEQAAPAAAPPPATNPAEQALRWIPTAAAALATTPAPRHRTADHRTAPARVPAPVPHR